MNSKHNIRTLELAGENEVLRNKLMQAHTFINGVRAMLLQPVFKNANNIIKGDVKVALMWLEKAIEEIERE